VKGSCSQPGDQPLYEVPVKRADALSLHVVSMGIADKNVMLKARDVSQSPELLDTEYRISPALFGNTCLKTHLHGPRAKRNIKHSRQLSALEDECWTEVH
jgi:hypothetical protein